MVVKVDNLQVTTELVEVVELVVLEKMVVVLQLNQGMVELQFLMQLLEQLYLMLAVAVAVHKVHPLTLELVEQVLLVEQVVEQELQDQGKMDQQVQLTLVVVEVAVAVELTLEEMVVQELLY
tara:strand:- start:153 stop:518 length:366 start_codon:yes stop_codon:yes gene_type:complete